MDDIMDRQIVYPGAIPLETDLLNTNKFAMTGLAKLASAIMGEGTCLHGLTCKPTVPASMNVEVGEGQIYSLQPVDGTPYSSLAADNGNILLKQGLNTSPCLFRLDAPAVQGYSINYLIQATYADTDTGLTVLPYYNATDPAIAYSGPHNSGNAQSTVRSGQCHLSVKAGVAARKGDQKTPTPDPGYTAAWIITVDHGALFVDASAIRVAESAPFIPEEGFIAAVQQGLLNRGKTLREKDNYRLICRPPVTKLTDGMRLFFRTPVTNTGSCTLRVDDFPPYPVFDDSSKELSKATLSICHQNEVEWNAALNAWILCNHQQQIDWDDVDKRYIPVSGGEVKGPLRVEGSLSTGVALKVGKSEITTEGDISGKVWNGSLLNWFMNRAARFVKDDDSSFVWKDPVSKLIIQGGNYRSKGGNVSYNTTFPNKCFVVLITQSGKRGMSKDNSHVDEVTIFGFNLHAGKGEPSFYWLAIGY